MSYLEDYREPPKREDRLKSAITYGGTLCGLAKKTRGCCLNDGERGFSQGSICLLLPGIAILNSLPDNVVLLHGAIGCGGCAHSQNANVRGGSNVRWGKTRDALWLSTALNETDIISGGEPKLEKAIIEADARYRPATITVVSGCVPGIIGDDIDGVIDRVQSQVNARLIPIHCEGFKTKIWATAYDAVYHGLGKKLLEEPEERENIIYNELDELSEKFRAARTVNLLNVSSMGRVDELELVRLLSALGLETNIYPVFAKPEEIYKATQASLSISVCPTHDDYFLKHLEEKYHIPYIIQHMPIGIESTGQWLRQVAAFFGLQDKAEGIIRAEVRELNEALAELRPLFAGKKVFVSAGEFRALATAGLLVELGFDLVGIRSYHHDEFAENEYEKLIKLSQKDPVFNIANAQPFEEVNLLKRIKPDLFLGHWNGNGTATKLGIPTHVIYNTNLSYIGYKGAYELARRLYRQLKNPAFNRNLSRYVELPYTREWYEADPFKYIKHVGGEAGE